MVNSLCKDELKMVLGCAFYEWNRLSNWPYLLAENRPFLKVRNFAKMSADDEHQPGAEEEVDSGSERERAERELRAERERKKAEVRKRLEEAGRAKKAKRGFLTPERKKKLRKLLMLKATEDLKLQQKKRAEERQIVLSERIPVLPELDSLNDDALLLMAEQFRSRIIDLESEIYDLSYMSRMKDFEINELTIAVNDLRGKFVKPTLKRISKTDTQFDKIKKQNAAKVDYRSTLKTREGTKFALEEVTEGGRVDEIIKRMEKRDSEAAASFDNN